MINVVLAIKDEKLYKELYEEEKINVISKNIQYKEGLLEVLEKNKNIDVVILNEKILGQISLEEVLIKIIEKNKKIKIILISETENLNKEKIINKNKILILKKEEINKKNILEIIIKKEMYEENKKENIIAILGARGSGKTVTMLLLCEIALKTKKTLIIGDNETCEEIINIYNITNQEEKCINENIEILNIKTFLENKTINFEKIINKIKTIKKNYDYIFIEIKNIYFYKKIKKIINKNILILNSNILEINKIKKTIKIDKLKIIFNNYNENAISEKIIEKIFKNKKCTIGKLKNNSKYNLIINNNMNISFLDNDTKKKINKIVEKI